MTEEPMVDKLERLEREATGAPWNVQNTTACYDVIQGGDRTTDSRYIAMMGVDYDPNTGESIPPHADADAALIVAMRNALPALLSQLREQRERADDAERKVERAHQTLWDHAHAVIEQRTRALAAERTVREQREVIEAAMKDHARFHSYVGNEDDVLIPVPCTICDALAALAPNTEGEG